MSHNGRQCLKNPDIQPTSLVIEEALGKAFIAYEKFVGEMLSQDIHMEWRYYNDGKAWLAKGNYVRTGPRGGQKNVTVFWLSIWEGFFKVTFFIPEKHRVDALHLPFGEEAFQIISGSQQMGKLKFSPIVFELCSEDFIEAVKLLVDFTKRIK